MSFTALDQFKTEHARLQQRRSDPAWLQTVRQQGLSRFSETGLPTTRHESWRYTNLSALSRIAFRAPSSAAEADGGTAADVTLSAVQAPQIQGASLLTFVDGQYRAELSTAAVPLPGLQVGSLSAALAQDDAIAARIRPLLSRSAEQGPHGAFAALNAALFEDGALVLIPTGATLEQPLRLLFISSGARPRTAAQLRNVVIAGAESRCRLVESHVSLSRATVADQGEQLTNVVSQLVLERGAQLELCRTHRLGPRTFQIGALQVEQAAASRFVSHLFTLEGALVRDEISLRLCGEDAECELNGLFMVDGERHVDNHTVIEHVAAHCRSQQLYKGILRDRGEGVFSGKICVQQGAQKTDARQSSKNLLLSEQAAINAKPQLEILADDVRCTHGATIGQLDEDALFYLKARGLDDDLARLLLVYAFASEQVERLWQPDLRTQLGRAICERLPGGELGGLIE